MRRRSAEICLYVPTTVALYILNQKRNSLNRDRGTLLRMQVMVAHDDSLIPPPSGSSGCGLTAIGKAPPVRPIQAPTLTETSTRMRTSEEAEIELEATAELPAAAERNRGEAERDRERPMTNATAAAVAGGGAR